jgi:predicted regulator of Ras-like GTPase activity (Roadblock/LC7/MglB family)
MAQISGLRDVRFAVADSGEVIGLWLTNADGSTFETSLRQDALNQLLGAMLSAVRDLAARAAEPAGQTRQITGTPVQASSLGLARGRTETEAFLAVNMGPVSMIFALELPELVS